MTKTIYRNAKKEKFTPISNSLLWDKEATLQAKGLLSIFLSNSNDWELNMKEIITRSKNGRDAHYKVVNELIELGYFARVQVIDPSVRKFEEMIYIFSDVKQEVADEIENVKQWSAANQKDLVIEYKTKKVKKESVTESQDTAQNPVTENQDTENKDSENQYINNTKFHKTKKNKTSSSSSSDSKNSIDSELKEKYPATPFEQIKEELLNDDTAVINTDKQYRSLLEYRLKTWKPRKSTGFKNNKKIIRKERLPEWFNEDEEKSLMETPKESEEDIAKQKQEIEEMLRKIRS